jgi:hypothetical protein
MQVTSVMRTGGSSFFAFFAFAEFELCLRTTVEE